MVNRIIRNFPQYKKILYAYLTSIYDYLLYKKLKTQIYHDPASNNILFFSDNTRLEMVRYANALKNKHGLSIILVVPITRVGKFFTSATFDKIYHFRNHWHFKRIIKSLEGIKIAHAFARTSKAANIFKQSFDIPLVVSYKDMTVTYYGINPAFNYLKKDIPYEKYILNNADGLIAESMEMAYARRTYAIQQKKPALFFPVYSSKQNFGAIKMQPPDYDHIHIVYLGAAYSSKADSDHFGAMQFHKIISWFEAQKIHFHIYPNFGLPPTTYSEYFKMANEHHYFHMHQPVAPEKLIQEISQYHFGIIPFFNQDTRRSVHKRKYATALKLFNFFEAGLPVIISKDVVFQAWMAKRYGGAIPVDKDDLRNLHNLIQTIDYPNMIQNIGQKRELYSIEQQSQRLVQFYNKILKS